MPSTNMTVELKEAGRLARIAAIVSLVCCGTAQSANFELFDGGVGVALDSTVSYGLSVRTEEPDKLQKVTGGNDNFKKGDIISNVVKGSHDLAFKLGESGNTGAFFRGAWYYDKANDDAPLRHDARTRGVSHADILDAYAYTRLGPEKQVTVRYGRQVISWGESIFIQGGINAINATDVSKLRTPGSELKEALLPTHAADVSWIISPSWSAEAFYLFEFEESRVDSAGTYFDTSGFVGDGGFRLGPLARGQANPPSNKGQYGIAIRHMAADLFQGVEFGAYYMNLHSSNPYLSVVRGRPAPQQPHAPASPPPPSAGIAQYYLDYAQNIEMWGASFNTIVGPWALGGEWSHRRNAPVQLDFFVNAALGAPTPLTNFKPVPTGTHIRGWDRLEVDQVQMGAQRLWGPRFGASQFNTIGEIGLNWVNDKPKIQTFEPITDSSWGYQLRSSLEYSRALFGIVNLTPGIAFRHDVHGVSSELGGKTFSEGRKSATLSLGWSYLINLTGELAYTNNWGGTDERNKAGSLLHNAVDRDFVSASISYQF